MVKAGRSPCVPLRIRQRLTLLLHLSPAEVPVFMLPKKLELFFPDKPPAKDDPCFTWFEQARYGFSTASQTITAAGAASRLEKLAEEIRTSVVG
jgi:hypothetical protein